MDIIHPFPICILRKFNDMAAMLAYVTCRVGSKAFHTTHTLLGEEKNKSLDFLYLACTFLFPCWLNTLYINWPAFWVISLGHCSLARRLILAASSLQCLSNYLNSFCYILPLLFYEREKKMESCKYYSRRGLP